METLRVGTRGSALALAQAGLVAGMLASADGVEPELVTIRTSGDAPAAADPGDKSRFVKEIEEALLAGEIDLAVHSAKDVPGVLPSGLKIVGVPARSDSRDALVGSRSLAELASGARVGTSSLRRRSQLLALRPDLNVAELRGNVDTRLRKLEQGDYDAVVLAAAGLERLGRDSGVLLDELVPAPGQGCLALEARADDERVARLGAALTDRTALVCLTAERAAVTRLDASCHTPVGVHASLDAGELRVTAYAGAPDGATWVRDELAGSPDEPVALGEQVGERMLAAGADAILSAAGR